MLKLDESKEDLLVSKYDFTVQRPGTNYMMYYYRGIVICPISNPKFSGRVILQSFSRRLQDKLYELIKDDILIQVPNTNKQEKMNKLKTQITRLEHQLKELEVDDDEM